MGVEPLELGVRDGSEQVHPGPAGEGSRAAPGARDDEVGVQSPGAGAGERAEQELGRLARLEGPDVEDVAAEAVRAARRRGRRHAWADDADARGVEAPALEQRRPRGRGVGDHGGGAACQGGRAGERVPGALVGGEVGWALLPREVVDGDDVRDVADRGRRRRRQPGHPDVAPGEPRQPRPARDGGHAVHHAAGRARAHGRDVGRGEGVHGPAAGDDEAVLVVGESRRERPDQLARVAGDPARRARQRSRVDGDDHPRARPSMRSAIAR